MIRWPLEVIPSFAAIFYNKVAADSFKNLHKNLANDIAREIKSGKILDVGTGPGYLPIEIAKLNSGLDITGIDLSHKMVEIAKFNAQKENVRDINFEVADANELPFEDKSFEFVISTAALHHWHDREKVFRQINRVLKKNGTAWIYELRRDARRDEIKKILKGPQWKTRYMIWAFKLHGLNTDKYYIEIKPLLESMKIDDLDIEKKYAFMRISWKKLKESS